MNRYRCGDNCKGECSGEVTGTLFCPNGLIVGVDDDCNIFYSDGRIITCPYRPHMTFQDCEVGYGGHGSCAKWNYNHQELRGEQ
jgi:hypothetical protein